MQDDKSTNQSSSSTPTYSPAGYRRLADATRIDGPAWYIRWDTLDSCWNPMSFKVGDIAVLPPGDCFMLPPEPPKGYRLLMPDETIPSEGALLHDGSKWIPRTETQSCAFLPPIIAPMAIKAAEGFPAAEEQDDKDWDRDEVRTEAKLEINRIIWQYGRPTMTLREAERLAVEFWSKLMEDRNI